METFLSSLYESVIDIDLLQEACHDESDDDGEQDDIAHHTRHRTHRILVHMAETPDNNTYKGAETAENGKHRRLQKIDALPQRRDDDTEERGYCRGQKNRDEDIGRLLGTITGTECQDGSRDNGEPRGVQHKEHDHRIRGRILLRIQLLHLLHSLEPRRRGCIVQTEHVTGYVHKDRAHDGMPFGDVREELGKDRTQYLCQHVDSAGFLSDFHDTQPQGQNTGKTERCLKSRLRGVKGGVHNLLKDSGVAHQQLHNGKKKGDDEKGYPNIIQYHSGCKGTELL